MVSKKLMMIGILQIQLIINRSKYNAEKFIENSENYIICRAGWMMGGGKEKIKIC